MFQAGSSRIFGFGRNAFGNIGDGSQIPRHSPTPVAPMFKFENISDFHTSEHSIILDNNQTIYCFGNNQKRQVFKYGTLRSVPEKYPFYNEMLRDVFVGMDHSLALFANGTIMAWVCLLDLN
jgi:alpha-tubulin suppressor-like RCC1 family protein